MNITNLQFKEYDMKQPIVRVAPNISPNAGHYGHLFICIAAKWVAQAIDGRVLVRIDWHNLTRGSLHSDATDEEKTQRQIGFKRVLNMSKLCSVSEVIDEYGARHSLDGIERPQKYRIFEDACSHAPIIYDYTHESLDENDLLNFLEGQTTSLCHMQGELNRELPLIMEHTHVSMSTFPKEYLPKLKELCIKTQQLPRRFHKAYCHMQMDELLGVTHIVRGNDFHSNRIRNLHEMAIHNEWGLPLIPLIRIPILKTNGKKISASEDDGITGLFPEHNSDVEWVIRTVIKPKYLDRFLPTLDTKWFKSLLTSNDPILDAPIWTGNDLKFEMLGFLSKLIEYQVIRMDKNIIFVICGPSGVGKKTLMNRLLEKNDSIIRCPSWTTRPLRDNEIDGVDYHYTDFNGLSALKKQGDLIGGTVEQFGFLYGIRASEIEQILESERCALVESNFIGIAQLKEHYKNVVTIFIAPPSIKVLANRLYSRKRETRYEIAARLSQARQILNEVDASLVDYYVINDDIDSCVSTLQAIICAEYHRLLL